MIKPNLIIEDIISEIIEGHIKEEDSNNKEYIECLRIIGKKYDIIDLLPERIREIYEFRN